MVLFNPASNTVYRPGGSVAAMADSRLLLGARPAAVINAAWLGLSCQSLLEIWSVPSLLRNSRVGLASTLVTPAAVRLGPSPRTITLSSPALFPSMKPAMTMLPPTPLKARVLILASFPSALLQVVDFHQPDAGGPSIAFHDRGILLREVSVARIADSRSFVGGMPVAWIAACWVVLQLLLMHRGKSGRTVQFQRWISQHIGWIDPESASTSVRSPG